MPRSSIDLAAAAFGAWLAVLSSACRGGSSEPRQPTATKLVLVSAPSAAAQTMVPLPAQPVLQTLDVNGTPAATTTTVTVEVMSGSATVMKGGSATTDGSGRAAFSELTLGAANGQVGHVTLRFVAPGLEPVTADVELQCAVLPLAIGQTVNGDLTTGDCTFASSGSFKNEFELTTSQPVTAVRLTEDATFAPVLSVRGANEPTYYWGRSVGVFNTDNRLSFKALLPPGRNRLAMSAAGAGSTGPGTSILVTGSYALTVSATTEDVTCELLKPIVASPITTAQQLATGDCVVSSFLVDSLFVGLPPNASITATMTSDAFQPRIELTDALTNVVLADATANGGASISFANGSGAKFCFLVLTSQTAGSAGPYTLNLNITYPTSNAASAASLPLSSQLPDGAITGDAAVLRRRLNVAHLPMAAR